MEAQRRGPRDIVVDRAGNPHDLDSKPFIQSACASKTAVAADDDQCTVFHVGLEMPHRGPLDVLILEVLEATASDRRARIAAHASRGLLGYGFDPIVRQS